VVDLRLRLFRVGVGGHLIAVIPSKDLVIVHRVANNPPREDSVPYWDVDTMILMIITAAPAHAPL